MFPMVFEEFLLTIGNTVTAPFIKDCFEKWIAEGEKLHRKLMKSFKTYFAIGGMPRAASTYIE